jgi:hypothetical protein
MPSTPLFKGRRHDRVLPPHRKKPARRARRAGLSAERNPRGKKAVSPRKRKENHQTNAVIFENKTKKASDLLYI